MKECKKNYKMKNTQKSTKQLNYIQIFEHTKYLFFLVFFCLTEEKCTSKNRAVENLLLKQNHTVRRRMRNNVDKRYTLLSIYFNFLYSLLVLIRVGFLLEIVWLERFTIRSSFNFNFTPTLIQFSILSTFILFTFCHITIYFCI
jgi:hypothetical protein